MSSTLRMLLYSLALSLSFNGPILALPPATISTPNPPQLSDEEAVRTLTEKYSLSIAAGDLEAMRQFWNPQSPNLASRLRIYQGLFSNTRIEFTSLKVIRLVITGDKAVSHLMSDERHLDNKTGAILSELGPFHRSCRSFEWIKTGAGWKIERELSVQEELAARLEAAASEQERDQIMEKEKVFVTNTLVVALTTRCQRHRFLGDYDAALRCSQLQQAVAEKIGDQSVIATVWLDIGKLKGQQDDFQEALLFQQRALELFEAAGNRLGAALTLANISSPYQQVGDYRKAFECAHKSLRLYEEMSHRRGTALALEMLAYGYRRQNNSQQALAYFERALLIYQELGDKMQIAIMRYELVRRHEELGNYDRALEIYQDLLKQTESHRDRVGAAIILEAIGSIHYEQGRYADARNYYLKSLQTSEAQNYKQGVVVALIGMSLVYQEEGNYAEALPLAERAVSMARQIVDIYQLHSAITSVGYCQLGLNHNAEARRAFMEAISIIEELRMQTAGGVEDRQRHFESSLNTYHGMLSLLVKENRTREALVLAERAKARALLDALQQGRAGVQKAMTAEEQEQEGRLKSELTRLNTQLTRATQSDKPDAERIGQIKTRLEKARLSHEDFQTSLYAAHPELKVQRGEASIINAEELAALLPDAAGALLEYVVTNEATYLFVVTKAQSQAEAEARVFTIPIKQAELVKQTEDFRRQLASRDLGFRASARKLYDLLLKSAQALLRGKTSLVIAPDDKLWELPFQALLSEDGRYVIERSAVSYVPSLTVLREMKAKRGAPQPGRRSEPAGYALLALGNPALGKETIERATLSLRDEKLDPLPEAEKEVKALSGLYGRARSKVYIGAEAREDRLKAEAGQARILHFATHGILNNASPMYSQLVLAQGEKNEDGLLEAWELMRLDLKADLAVLSACETARGRFGAGEGLIGLTWAMFIAGVPSTVVSQWKVESASTRELMLNFHRHLLAPQASAKLKATKAGALRQAALTLMNNPETGHPFYWAGFVLVGNDR
jgi:CHAT domain-containing protein